MEIPEACERFLWRDARTWSLVTCRDLMDREIPQLDSRNTVMTENNRMQKVAPVVSTFSYMRARHNSGQLDNLQDNLRL